MPKPERMDRLEKGQAELLKTYLAELRAQLPPGLGWGARERILCEVEEHVLAASEEARQQGQPAALAMQQALERCGSPATIAEGFRAVADLRRVRLTRAGLLTGFVLCIGLTGLTFLRYPAIVGSSSMLVFYLAISAAILGGYVWVGLPTHQAATPQGIVPLRQGTAIGLFTGIVGSGAGLVGSLALMALWSYSSPASAPMTLWVDHRIQEATFAISSLAWCISTFVGSVTATMRTGRSFTGLQIGFWSSMVYSVFSTVTSLTLTHLLAGALAQTVWPHDAFCRATRDAATCAIGDSLGGMTNALLLTPVLGIGIGWLGGKLGSQESQTPAAHSQAAESVSQRLRSIPLFVVWSCGLFLIGLIGHLW